MDPPRGDLHSEREVRERAEHAGGADHDRELAGEWVSAHGARAIPPRPKDQAADPDPWCPDPPARRQPRSAERREHQQHGTNHQHPARSARLGERHHQDRTERRPCPAGRGEDREQALAATGIEPLRDHHPEREIGGGCELLTADQRQDRRRGRRERGERGEAGQHQRGDHRQAREHAAALEPIGQAAHHGEHHGEQRRRHRDRLAEVAGPELGEEHRIGCGRAHRRAAARESEHHPGRGQEAALVGAQKTSADDPRGGARNRDGPPRRHDAIIRLPKPATRVTIDECARRPCSPCSP